MKKTSLLGAPRAKAGLDAFIMHSSPTLEIMHICLAPGQEIPQHANPFDVVACLVLGEVTMAVGDIQSKLEVYDMVEVEKNLARGFTNTGNSEARLIIIKKL